MRQILGLLLLISIYSCEDNKPTAKDTHIDTTTDSRNKVIQLTTPVIANPYGIDSSYEISITHSPFLVTGYYNEDQVLDTAILIKQKSTGRDALFIKHGGINTSFLLESGKDVGADFEDFNWVGVFFITPKGTKVWDNTMDGEIVDGNQIPDNLKFILKTDGIFVHVDEGSGGGVIYFKSGRYAWVQQE